MALRAFLFIAGLFGVRLYALFARGLVHEHAPRGQTPPAEMC